MKEACEEDGGVKNPPLHSHLRLSPESAEIKSDLSIHFPGGTYTTALQLHAKAPVYGARAFCSAHAALE